MWSYQSSNMNYNSSYWEIVHTSVIIIQPYDTQNDDDYDDVS